MPRSSKDNRDYRRPTKRPVDSRDRALASGQADDSRLLDQAQSDDVGEVGAIQRPEGGTVRDGAGRDGEIDLPAPRPPHPAVRVGRNRRFHGAERDRFRAGEEGFLSAKFLARARPAPPLVEDER